jgi:hypothetical protein
MGEGFSVSYRVVLPKRTDCGLSWNTGRSDLEDFAE